MVLLCSVLDDQLLRMNHLSRINIFIELFFRAKTEFQSCFLQARVVLVSVLGNLGSILALFLESGGELDFIAIFSQLEGARISPHWLLPLLLFAAFAALLLMYPSSRSRPRRDMIRLPKSKFIGKPPCFCLQPYCTGT